MPYEQRAYDESGIQDWFNTETNERMVAGFNPNPEPVWKDRMGQYSQGTLALEHFGGETGNGVAIVDANTGQRLTRVGDPGWYNMQALYDAGYTKFVNEKGIEGTFEDFGRELGFASQEMEKTNQAGMTGLGGTNTLRDIVSGVARTAMPALIGPLSSALGISPSIVGPAAAGSLAAATGGNPLLEAATSVLMNSIVPNQSISNDALLYADAGNVTDFGMGDDTLGTLVGAQGPGMEPGETGSFDQWGVNNPPSTGFSLPNVDLSSLSAPAAGVAGVGVLSEMGQDTGSGYDYGLTGNEGETLPTIIEGGSIGGGDYGGDVTGGYTQPDGTSFGTEGGVVPTPSWWDSAWGKFEDFSKTGLGKFLLGNIGTNSGRGFLGRLFGNVLDANTMRSLYADLDKTMNRAIDVSSPFRNEYPKYQPTLYNTVMNPSQYLEEPEGIPQQIAKATRQTVSPGGGYMSGREQNAVAHSLFDTYDKRVSQLGTLSGAQFGPGQAGQVAATMGTQAANARAGSMFPYGDVLRSLFGRP